MHDLALGYLTLADAPPADLVTAAGAGGFRATGLRITGHKPGDDGPDIVGNRRATDELKRRAADAGVRLVNVSTYRFLPEISVGDYAPVLETCAELGVGTMIANCFIPDDGLAAAKLAACCELAGGFGIAVALEFIPVSAVKTLDHAARLMRTTGQPNAGLVIDALHLWRSGGSPADIAAVPAEMIRVAQLCDAPLARPEGADLYAEMRSGRLYPGAGELDLHALLDALPAHAELEAEVPNGALAHLPAGERARRAREATERFLEAYRAERSVR